MFSFVENVCVLGASTKYANYDNLSDIATVAAIKSAGIDPKEIYWIIVHA